MTKAQIDKAVSQAIETGNWMIRQDNAGVAYGGFEWKPLGQWTEAPDFSPETRCGGGLHGQNHLASGYSTGGSRLVFCETRGQQINLSNKIKVPAARALLIDQLPPGLTFRAGLSLQGCTALTSLPEGLKVGGDLYLCGCTALTSLPEGLKVGGDLDLTKCTAFTSLPEGLEVGGGLDLRGCTALTSLPEGLKVGWWLDLRGCTALTSLPEGLEVGGSLYLPDHLKC